MYHHFVKLHDIDANASCVIYWLERNSIEMNKIVCYFGPSIIIRPLGGGQWEKWVIIFSCQSATIQSPFCVSPSVRPSVQSNFSESVGVRKLKFGTKEVHTTV